jgi:transposase
VLAFVHPVSGRTEWQFASGINTAVMSVALESFARALGAGPTKRIVLVLDQAGYHTSPLVEVPTGIHLVFLPPYSPALKPAEHLWHYCDQVLINAHFATIDELEDTLAEHCDRLQRQQDVIRSATLFHWRPATGVVGKRSSMVSSMRVASDRLEDPSIDQDYLGISPVPSPCRSR